MNGLAKVRDEVEEEALEVFFVAFLFIITQMAAILTRRESIHFHVDLVLCVGPILL